MALNRKDALEALKEVLEELVTSGDIKTVVRTYSGENFDITNYKTIDLPLIEIQEPEEATDTQMTSMRAMMALAANMKLWFVSWSENPTSAYESLVKKIRDKIGNNFKLKNTTTGTWVIDVSFVSGELPVYGVLIGLAMKYYLNQKDS